MECIEAMNSFAEYVQSIKSKIGQAGLQTGAEKPVPYGLRIDVADGEATLPVTLYEGKKGFSLVVHDVNGAAVDKLVDLGAEAGADAADVAARSEIIITMLPNSAIVQQVICGPGGVLSTAKAGSLVMDMSTVSPETTDAVAAACRAVVRPEASTGLVLSATCFAASAAAFQGWAAPSHSSCF